MVKTKVAKTDRITVRIDPDTKKQAADLFDSLDMTLSDAVAIFLRQSLYAKGLPFSVNLSNKDLQKANYIDIDR